MERNVYDFDKTIFHRDSTAAFILYCIRRYPLILLDILASLPFFIGMMLGKVEKTKAKEKLFRFLRRIPDPEKQAALFWDQNMKGILTWYLEQKEPTDLIISASPEFLVREATGRLGISLIASRVEPKTGRYTGKNCYGEEKTVRLKQELPDTHIREFYSDSKSDTPLAELAERAYLVSGNRIRPFFQ